MSVDPIPDDAPIPAEVMTLARDMLKAQRPMPQIAEATGLSQARLERMRPPAPKPKGGRSWTN